MPRLHIFVHGRVQGVFFRAFTQEVAQELGLVGWVRNCEDGRVEVVAEGERSKLEVLAKRLKKGPPNAHVDYLDIKWEKKRGDLAGFEILYH